MSVIAEGIESEDQVRARRQCGVEEGQGYLVSPPMPPAKSIELIEDSASEVRCPEALKEAGRLTSTEILQANCPTIAMNAGDFGANQTDHHAL